MFVCWVNMGLRKIHLADFLSKRPKKYGPDPIYVLKLHLCTAVRQTRLINRDLCVLPEDFVAMRVSQKNTCPISSKRPKKYGPDPIYVLKLHLCTAVSKTAQIVRDWPNLRFKIAFVHCGKQTRLINRDYVCCLKILLRCGFNKKKLGRFPRNGPKSTGLTQFTF